MLVIERGVKVLRGLPRLTQLGIGALMVGLALDLLAHLGWASGLAAGHIVTLAGMLLAVAGVFTLAFHRAADVPLAEKRR
jgi:hypothetical protein